jgi:Protein of unknown function (DUF3047)
MARAIASVFRALVVIAVTTAVLAPRASDTAPALIRVDTWETAPDGPLDLTRDWQLNPYAPSMTFRYPPAIVRDGTQRALRLRTERETMSLWRMVKADLQRTPRLVWEWKALRLPAGGDVRQPRRNDQAARVMVLFEGMNAIVYVWDTQAPIGTEVRPDEFAAVNRALIVVRSGADGLGHWQQEQRDVRADHRRIFGDEPRPVKLMSVESHSDDVAGESEALFGAIRFER